MAQLMKQTLVFGAGAIGLAALIQGASADTEVKSMTLAEVKAENAKRIAAYESEKREIDERNRAKRAQYRDAYAHYAEFANRGEAEPKAPEYEALPTLELLDEPVELPFDVAGATPHESTFMSEHHNNVAIPESSSATVSENDTPSGTVVAELHETTEKSDTLSNVAISEVNETTEKLSSDGKVSEPETHSTKTKEAGAKEKASDATTSETKETSEKTSSDTTTSEIKETGEKTSSDATASETKKLVKRHHLML